MTSKRTASQIIRQIVQRRHPGVGCADGSCIFGHPGGMQTNGGCACIKERDYPMPQRNLMVLRDVVQVLASIVSEEDLEAQAQWEEMLKATRERNTRDDLLAEVTKERDEARKVAGEAIKAGGEIIKERDEARAEVASLKELREQLADDARDTLAHKVKDLETLLADRQAALEKAWAEEERLKEWLERIAIDANDSHPRMTNLENCREVLRYIDRHVQAAQRGEEAP